MDQQSNNEFDIKAKAWDENPEHINRSKVIAEAIKTEVPFDPSFTAMEFGCGTGLISFSLRDHFSKITLVDSSQGMLNVLKKKISDGGITNMMPLNVDLMHTEDIKAGPFSVIFSSLVLHHIDNVEKVFKIWHSLLMEKGYLCIADIDSEDGSFHGHDFKGHNGFDRKWLEQLALSNGFSDIKFRTVYEIIRTDADGKERSYPVFLMVCRR
jgi:ubiquinone/menaquinone biosynthesis C-methylase UbiE